jgi:hypothetical protein
MIAPRSAFGGGGGGGNRAVIFTVGIRAADADKQLDAIGKKVDDIAKRAANIRVGVGGGVGGIGGGGGGGGAGATSGGASTAASRTSNRPIAGSAEAAANDLGAQIKKSLAAATSLKTRSDNFYGPAPSSAGGRGGRGGSNRLSQYSFGEALEGVGQLSRSFALLSASSEQNLEKLIRKLAKVEAVIQGMQGFRKIAGPLGGLLSSASGSLGIAAGGTPWAVGAAGLAAGIGVLGGGLAIRDQINYSQTGKVGAYSGGVSRFYAGIARTGYDLGLTNESLLRNSSTPYGRLAASQISLERGQAGYANDISMDSQYGSWQLGNARGDLANTERSFRRQGMRQSMAMDFYGMSRGQQRRLLRRRDKYLDDPSSMRGNKAMSIYGLLGPSGQEDFRAEAERQATDRGLFSRGADDLGGNQRVPPIKLDEVLLKREVVVKLEAQNDELAKRLEAALAEALKSGNSDLEEKVRKAIERAQATADQANTNFQNSQNTIGNLRGY